MQPETQPAAQRVVSLLPAATEMMVALGYEAQLVGRSHECDYPASVQDLPACTRSNLKASGSEAIDNEVKDLLKDGLSLYDIDIEQLKALKPDLILTQAQCEVCAVSLAEVEKAVQEHLDSAVKILSLQPEDMGDVWTDIRNIAKAMGDEEKGHHLVFKLQQRQATVAAGALDSPPRVVCIEWMKPLMAAGNWMPELVEMASGDNLIGVMGEHSPTISWQELVDVAPDMLILMPCGYTIEDTKKDMALLTEHPQWSELPAVKKGEIYIADGHQYFNRPGPRLAESLEILGEILHPETFHFGHEGTGWIKWQG